MKRRLVLLLALLVVSTGLGLGIHQWTQRGVIIIGDPSWPGLKLTALSRIDMSSPKGSFSVIPVNGAWYSVPDMGGRTVLVSSQKLQTLLDTIGQSPPLAHITRFTRREKALYGLDNSTISITLHGTDIWGIVLGKDTTDGEAIFARSSLQGDQVVSVDKRYRDLLSRSVESFYDLRLLSATGQDDIAKISAEGPGVGVWEVSRKSDSFIFTSPAQQTRHSVDEAKAELYIHTLLNARAKGVASLSNDKLPPPQLKLAVWTKDSSTPETIELYHNGNDGKNFIGKLSRQVTPVVVDADLMEQLAVSAFALREKPVLEVDLSQAEEQQFSIHGKESVREFTAIRSATGWREKGGSTELTGLDVIMWRLGALQFVDAPRKTAPAGANLLLKWQLNGNMQQPLATVFFYTDPVSAGRCWVRVQGEDIWFPVDRLLLNDLLSRLPAL